MGRRLLLEQSHSSAAGKGYNVTAAQIPLTSLSDDIAVTRSLLSAQKGPTVLVGHSYGGAVITGAATTTPQVKALVYITAFEVGSRGELRLSASKDRPRLGLPRLRLMKAAFFGSTARNFTNRSAAMSPMMKLQSWQLYKSP
jgi:pimeloyl-ACP methyl ester carboxylesterase